MEITFVEEMNGYNYNKKKEEKKQKLTNNKWDEILDRRKTMRENYIRERKQKNEIPTVNESKQIETAI